MGDMGVMIYIGRISQVTGANAKYIEGTSDAMCQTEGGSYAWREACGEGIQTLLWYSGEA